MFLQVSVCPGGGIPACIAGGIPACLAGLRGVVSQHALQADPPPQQTATAAGGTYPTGMHSCLLFIPKYQKYGKYLRKKQGHIPLNYPRDPKLRPLSWKLVLELSCSGATPLSESRDLPTVYLTKFVVGDVHNFHIDLQSIWKCINLYLFSFHDQNPSELRIPPDYLLQQM